MVSRQIIQFKCVVGVCDQDFGAFCRERDPEEKKRFGEQPGATKPAFGDALGALVEVETVLGAVEWQCWELGAMLEVAGWLVELRSLLGWLWRQCVFKLEAGRRKFAITLISVALRLCCARLLSKLHSGAGNQTPLGIG